LNIEQFHKIQNSKSKIKMLEKLGQVCGIVGKHLMNGIFFGGDSVNLDLRLGRY
jgi:hypothetical protein